MMQYTGYTSPSSMVSGAVATARPAKILAGSFAPTLGTTSIGGASSLRQPMSPTSRVVSAGWPGSPVVGSAYRATSPGASSGRRIITTGVANSTAGALLSSTRSVPNVSALGAFTSGVLLTSTTGSAVGPAKPAKVISESTFAVQQPSAADLGGSIFEDVKTAPPDAILTLATWFKEDKDPNKVNLGIGAYRTEEGKPWPLPSVLAAQLAVCQDPNEDKEYVPIDGKPEHKKPVQQLIFSDAEIASGTIATAQALSGTGSLQVIGQFLNNFLACKVIHMPKPTWGNHQAIFKRAGLTPKDYIYYKPETRGFDFEGMIESMNAMEKGEAILLHACAQNPTGVDPTPEQWQVIVAKCQERGLVPVLDNAYQGYASGDLAKDGLSMLLFEDSGMEYFVAQSFAKNFGLYGERIGYIHVRCKSKELASAVLSQLKILIRQAYSSPPRHGAAIVNKLLTTPSLKAQWLEELKFMSDRILQMRDALRGALEANGTPGTWNHITDQIGMFSFTGLNTEQVEKMVNEYHIYMTKDGRISIAGLNPGNVQYVADCINTVVTTVP